MKRDDPEAVWWCPDCHDAFELGEAAFSLDPQDQRVLCPNIGCKAELEAA